MKKPIGIVLINYFNDDEVISFISNQLRKQTEEEIQVYVLDNGSDNNELKVFCESERAIKYYKPGNNLGYIGGFLHVIDSLKSLGPGKIILSNTDIEIDTDLLERIGAYELNKDEVMLGPDLISTRTHHSQNPFYEHRISESKLRMLNFVFSSWLTYSAYKVLGIMKAGIKGKTKKKVETGVRPVYAIHGSFMIFKTSFVETYSAELHDAPFLFGEELRFAETALKHHLQILYCPQFKINHHEHATTQLFRSGKMLKHLKNSIDFFLKKRMEEKA